MGGSRGERVGLVIFIQDIIKLGSQKPPNGTVTMNQSSNQTFGSLFIDSLVRKLKKVFTGENIGLNAKRETKKEI